MTTNEMRAPRRTRRSWANTLTVSAIATVLGISAAGPALAQAWIDHPPMPFPRANNAVTSHEHDGTCYVYSFTGIDETKIWSGISQTAMRLNTDTDVWEVLPDVPGSVGRIATLAASVKDKVYLFGGYSVSSGGAETSWASVDIFDPATLTWSAGTDMPVAIDDQVGGVWADSLVYMVSGWSQTQSVRNVQIYNPTSDSWQQAGMVPFQPTFGGSGGVIGNYIVYADGVNNGFNLVNRVSVGEINPADPTDVTWTEIGAHPGPAGYRMGSGVHGALADRVFFTGGSDNAYNFNGMGYDGNPSEPLAWTFELRLPGANPAYHLDRPTPVMDHRGFADCNGRLYIAGGMEGSQTVTTLTSSFAPEDFVAVPGGDHAAADRFGLGVAPNPAVWRTRVFLEGAGTGEGNVLRSAAIYDAGGREVRTFDDIELAEGRGFEWDLTANDGTRVTPGVYWLRGSVFDRSVARRIVVN